MNFLAHLYLSDNNEQLMVGNFIADHLRGKHWKSFPDTILKGIALHRFIDAFTDSHAEVEKTKALLRPFFHKYTPVVADIYYDHFLAAKWTTYSQTPLDVYSMSVYELLHRNQNYLPARTIEMLVYMERDNWLLHYESLTGIDRALRGMGKRARFENNMHEAAAFLEIHYATFQHHFDIFFPLLKMASEQFLKQTAPF